MTLYAIYPRRRRRGVVASPPDAVSEGLAQAAVSARPHCLVSPRVQPSPGQPEKRLGTA